MNLKRKFLLVMLIVVTLITIMPRNYVSADTTSKIFNLAHQRYLYNKLPNGNIEYIQKNEYAINGSRNRPIFQVALRDENDSSLVAGTNYFCLDANTSYTWYGTGKNITDTVTYSSSSDLESATGKSKIAQNYNQIMWLLDNMYLATNDSGEKNSVTGNSKAIETFLSKAGIVYGELYKTPTTYSYYYNEQNEDVAKSVYYGNDMQGYYYMDGDTQVNVLLTPELIEAVEQAVIWYFTNGSSDSDFSRIYLTPSKTNTQFGNTATLLYGANNDNLVALNSLGDGTTYEGK